MADDSNGFSEKRRRSREQSQLAETSQSFTSDLAKKTGQSFNSADDFALERLKVANDGPQMVHRICRIVGRVVGAKGLPRLDALSPSDPFCVVKAIKGNNHTLNVHLTDYIQNTTTPLWNEEFDFQVPDKISEEVVGLRLAVYAADGPFCSYQGSNDFMGGTDLDLAGQKHARSVLHELELGGIPIKKASGRKPRITVAVTVYRDLVPRGLPRQLMLKQSLTHLTYVHQVFGCIMKATDLPNAELVGLSDPFCIVRAVLLSGQVTELFRSKVVNDTLRPVWNEPFQAAFATDQPLLLLFDLWDEDDSTKPLEEGGAQHLGSAVVPLLSCLEPAPRRRRLWLQGSSQRHESKLNSNGVPHNDKGGRLTQKPSITPGIGMLGRAYQKSLSFDQGPAVQKSFLVRLKDAAVELKKSITQQAVQQKRPVLTIELRAYTQTVSMPFRSVFVKPFFVHDGDDVEKCLESGDWKRSAYSMPAHLQIADGQQPERGALAAEDHISFIYGVIEGASSLPVGPGGPPEAYCVVHAISTQGGRHFVHRTRSMKQLACPQWHEAFYAGIPEDFEVARLQLGVYGLNANGFSHAARKAAGGLLSVVHAASGGDFPTEKEASKEEDDWFIGRAHVDLTTVISGSLIAEEVPVQGGSNPKQDRITSGFRLMPCVAFEVMVERRLRPSFTIHSGDGVQMIPRRHHQMTRSSDPVMQSLPILDGGQLPMLTIEDTDLEAAAQEAMELARTGTLAMRKGVKPDWSKIKEEEEPEDEPPAKPMSLLEDSQMSSFMIAERRKQKEVEEVQQRLVDFTRREPRRKVRSLPVLKTKFGETPENLFHLSNLQEPPKVVQARFSAGLAASSVARELQEKPMFTKLQWRRPTDLL